MIRNKEEPMTFDEWYQEQFGESYADDQYYIAKQAWEAGFREGYEEAKNDYKPDDTLSGDEWNTMKDM